MEQPLQPNWTFPLTGTNSSLSTTFTMGTGTANYTPLCIHEDCIHCKLESYAKQLEKITADMKNTTENKKQVKKVKKK